jgi:hypothetical protein
MGIRYEVRILPDRDDDIPATLGNTTLVTNTRFKLWALIRQQIAVWRTNNCVVWLIVCRPPEYDVYDDRMMY